MQIMTGTGTYIQKQDIQFMLENSIPMTEQLYIKLVTLYEDTKGDFVKIEKFPQSFYLATMEWLLDYDELKDLSEEQLIFMAQDLMQERGTLLDTLTKIPESKVTHRERCIKKINCIEHQVKAIRDVYYSKKGLMILNIPTEEEPTTKRRK